MSNKKLRILVDMDGIVADLLTEWLARYNHDYNDDLGHSDMAVWKMEHNVPTGVDIFSYLTPDLFSSLRPIVGSVDAIHRISSAGHDVTFVTAAPRGCADAKVDWAHKYFPSITEVIVAHSKHLITGDVFIDDSPGNIHMYRKTHPSARIMTVEYEYNKHMRRSVNIMSTVEEAWKTFEHEIEWLQVENSFEQED